MNRVVLLVLANLALAGCGKKSGPVDPPPEAHDDCARPEDCTNPKHPWCMKVGDAGTGKCYPYPREGRPLAIDGEVHVAAFTGTSEAVDDTTIHRLRAAAQDEHASVAAFARTIAELMALGAPLSLLSATQAALADELRHTEATLAVLEKLTGARPALGPLPAAASPLARSVEDFCRDVLVGGAIGETLAAAAAETRRPHAPTSELRALDEMIVVDESRHAALAFETLAWLLRERPELRPIVDEERARLDPATLRLVAPLFEAALS